MDNPHSESRKNSLGVWDLFQIFDCRYNQGQCRLEHIVVEREVMAQSLRDIDIDITDSEASLLLLKKSGGRDDTMELKEKNMKDYG